MNIESIIFLSRALELCKVEELCFGIGILLRTITMMKQSGRSYRANVNAIYDEGCMVL